MRPQNKSHAQKKKSSKDAKPSRLVNGSGQPTPSPAAGTGQSSHAEDRTRAIDLVDEGQQTIRRERFAFVLGLALHQLIRQPGESRVEPESEGDVEKARGADVDFEVMEGEGAKEDVEVIGRRAAKRKMEAPLEGYHKPCKVKRLYRQVRFNRRVRIEWASRELAICEKRPFIFFGAHICSTTQKIKKPEPRQRPRKFSREQADVIAAQYADSESVTILEPRPRPEGCTRTCKDGCTPDCSCLANGLKCSTSYGCACKHETCQNQKNGPITLLEYVRRKLEQVEIANEKTQDWTEKVDDTIESEGSIDDEEMGQDVQMSDEEENDSPDEADIAMVEPDSPRFSPPPSPIQDLDFSPPLSPFDGIPQADSTMRLEDGEDSPDGSDSSSTTDSDDSDDDDGRPQIDLAPDQFSADMLQLIPAMIDQQEVDSCEDGELLGSVALFVGLLQVATIANQKNDGRKVGVAHPDLFKDVVDMVEKRKAEDVRPDVLRKNIVYGSGWTDLLIPMHVSGAHWVVAVICRSLVSCTIYDSLNNPMQPELFTAALKKILVSIQNMNPEDKTTGRFKLRYCRPDCREVQQDGTSCGLFAIGHARRALQRQNGSNAPRQGDPPIDVLVERRTTREELMRLMDWFEWEENAGRQWAHAPGTRQLRCYPAKTPVVLRYSGRRH